MTPESLESFCAAVDLTAHVIMALLAVAGAYYLCVGLYHWRVSSRVERMRRWKI